MVYLKNIEQVRAVEWSQQHLWDIRFPGSNINTFDKGAPKPFDEWFPANDVEDNMANLETHMLEVAMTSLKLPLKSSVRDLKITFIDDKEATLEKWFTEWMNFQILNEDKTSQAIATLETSVKLVQLQRLGVTEKTYSYYVYPEGSIHFHGSSESGAHVYSLSFVKAGKHEK